MCHHTCGSTERIGTALQTAVYFLVSIWMMSCTVTKHPVRIGNFTGINRSSAGRCAERAVSSAVPVVPCQCALCRHMCGGVGSGVQKCWVTFTSADMNSVWRNDIMLRLIHQTQKRRRILTSLAFDRYGRNRSFGELSHTYYVALQHILHIHSI